MSRKAPFIPLHQERDVGGTGISGWWPLLAVLAAGAAPAQAATTTAVAKAAVIAPLSLLNTAPLSFGDIAAGATRGMVVVTPLGARTTTGGTTPMGGIVSPAGFTGTAAGVTLVIIRYPLVPVVLTRIGGGATMPISAFTIEGGQFRLLAGRQAFNFRIGGTLQVAARQADGAYEGSFAVTIDYF